MRAPRRTSREARAATTSRASSRSRAASDSRTRSRSAPLTLADAAAIAVVLGGPSETITRSRARRAAALALEHPAVAVVVSGQYGADAPVPARTEAALMREVLVAMGVAPARIHVEDESRDTVDNALFTARRYLAGVAPRTLYLVTSAFHLPRATRVFAHVLPSWRLEGVASEPLPEDDTHARNEPALQRATDALLAGTAPGDLDAIAARLHARPGRDRKSSRPR